MNHARGELSMISKKFVLERMRVHAQFYLSNYPSLRRSCDILETMNYFDRDMQRCFMLVADMAKGEVTQEKKTVEQTVTINVFASWVDHLKFRAAKRYPRLKRWLKVAYVPVSKTVSLTVPVTVTRACPHVTQSWDDRPGLHVAFLKPTEWSRQYGNEEEAE